MNTFKAVIFDCDGVMFDTLEANRSYYNRILSHFNRPEMSPAQFAYAQMHTAENSIAHLFSGNRSLIEKAHAYRKKMTYIPFIKHMIIEPDLKPLLKKLRPAYLTAIATNRTDTMPHVLKNFHLEDLFDMVVSALDVSRPKPHPDQLIKIIDQYGLNPRQAVYIGDSEVDEQAAEAAGIPLAAYNNPSLSADFHIQRLKEVEDILLS